MDRVRHERVKWKCRRGLLELDLLLERFLRSNTEFKEEELVPLEALLDLPDNDLWDVISGRSDAFDSRLRDIVARLRAC
jgi:antitoxin CptB